ncbi:MAG: sugar phosphate isomerase/epimerase [Armatimonadota bacterium]|nr:sugar phosphate isomerase/epimerase [bacterium]
MKPVAIQLYSLREAAAKDFPGVLKAVADIGYVGVEFAGLHGYDPKEIAKLVDDLGLRVSSSHTGLPTKESVKDIVNVELALGNKWVVTGFGPDAFGTMDAVCVAADKFNMAAELIKPHGMDFAIHNHWWEFDKVDGRYVFDILMENAPEIYSELDVYWTQVGGANPAKIVSKYSSRMPLLHIKDGPGVKGQPHTAVGSGVMDIPSIIGAADENTLQWVIVELDECATDMLEAVKKSYEYLTSKGLAKGNK